MANKIDFQASKASFTEALNTVSAAAADKPVVPYAACVHVKAYQDGAKNSFIELEASNGSLSMREVLSDFGDLADPNLRVDGDGELLINASYLVDAVSKLDGDIVHIYGVDGYLTAIEGANAKFRINGANPADFPALSIPETCPVIMNGALTDVLDICKRASFAVAKKAAGREVLLGINFAPATDALTVTATDSYRLAELQVRKSDALDIGTAFAPVTVPASAISALSALKGKNVELRTDGKVLSVFDDHATAMMSVLYEGAYPDVHRVIPTTFAVKAQFNRAELADALSRSLFIKTDSVSVVTLDLNADNALMTSVSQEIGAYKQEIKPVAYEGDALKVAFSGEYLLQALKALNGDTVTMSFTGALKPFIVTGSDGAGNVQLLLPVRTYETNTRF